MSADWCPYFTADVQTTTSTNSEELPSDKRLASNETVMTADFQQDILNDLEMNNGICNLPVHRVQA